MKKTLIRVKKIKRIKEKVQGLIGKNKPFPIMLVTRFGIHTFGLKFPIDVLILNNENKVVSIKEGMKPRRVFLWNPYHKKVLELPAGTIKEKAIKINDVLSVES